MVNESSRDIEKLLSEILKECAKSLCLTNYETHFNTDCSKGDGFLSEFFNATILNKNTGESFPIGIKLSPNNNMLSDYETVFTNEIYFYSSVFPILDSVQKEQSVKEPFNNVPKYFTGSARSRQEFIAMENLIPSGYKLIDKKKPIDSKHLELIFKTYGKFHALSFVFKEKNLNHYNELVEKIIDPFKSFPNINDLIEMMRASYYSAMDSLDPVTEAEFKEKLKKLDYSDAGFLEAYKGEYTCLRHGDCWSNNMMFKYKDTGEPIDIKLLDFQVTCPGTPIHDLSYFFYSGASKEDMDKLDYYLELYYRSFSEFARELGGDPNVLFPFEVLEKEWKEYGTYGLYLGFHLWAVKLMDKEEIVEICEKNSLPVEQFWVLWGERFDKVRKGSEYKQKTRDLCLHAVEYGLV